MRLSAMKVDSKSIEQGRWVDNIPGSPGLRLRMRGFGNADDRRVRARELGALPKESFDEGGNLLPLVSDRVMTTRIVDAIFLEWEGLTDDADAPIASSPEKAAELLANPDYRPLFDAMVWAATQVGQIQADADESAVKN